MSRRETREIFDELERTLKNRANNISTMFTEEIIEEEFKKVRNRIVAPKVLVDAIESELTSDDYEVEVSEHNSDSSYDVRTAFVSEDLLDKINEACGCEVDTIEYDESREEKKIIIKVTYIDDAD